MIVDKRERNKNEASKKKKKLKKLGNKNHQRTTQACKKIHAQIERERDRETLTPSRYFLEVLENEMDSDMVWFGLVCCCFCLCEWCEVWRLA